MDNTVSSLTAVLIDGFIKVLNTDVGFWVGAAFIVVIAIKTIGGTIVEFFRR